MSTQKLSQQIKDAAKCGPKTTQSEVVSRLRTELAQLKQHCNYQQAAYDGLEKQKVLEVQGLEDRLRAVREENEKLLKQCEMLASGDMSNQ